jgi:hypothetical protein
MKALDDRLSEPYGVRAGGRIRQAFIRQNPCPRQKTSLLAFLAKVLFQNGVSLSTAFE